MEANSAKARVNYFPGNDLNLGRVSSERKNAFIPVKRDNSVNTYSRISTVPRGSEQSE